MTAAPVAEVLVHVEPEEELLSPSSSQMESDNTARVIVPPRSFLRMGLPLFRFSDDHVTCVT